MITVINQYQQCLSTLTITCVFIQVLMFTADGTVKQNMQTITLPYHTGGPTNKRRFTDILHLHSQANELNCVCLFLNIPRWHQHIPRLILSHLAPDYIWAADADPACACDATLCHSGPELQSKNTRYVWHLSQREAYSSPQQETFTRGWCIGGHAQLWQMTEPNNCVKASM